MDMDMTDELGQKILRVLVRLEGKLVDRGIEFTRGEEWDLQLKKGWILWSVHPGGRGFYLACQRHDWDPGGVSIGGPWNTIEGKLPGFVDGVVKVLADWCEKGKAK